MHGTWLPVAMFEKHLKLMKWLGYETRHFADLAENGFIHRLQCGKEVPMITVDDGHRDNLTRMLAAAGKKYGATRRWSAGDR